MHRTVRGWLGLAAVASLSLLVQDRLHGLDIDGAWLGLVIAAAVLTISVQFGDWRTIANWLATVLPLHLPSHAESGNATELRVLALAEEFPDYLRVHCAECGCELPEDEAQAQRWGYSLVLPLDVYPFCPDCAEREFGPVPEVGHGL